jgi:hypothetical protein
MITKEALIGSLGGIPERSKARTFMPSPFSPKTQLAEPNSPGQRPRSGNDVQPARLARPSGVGPPWAKSRSSTVWSTGIDVPLAI